MYYIPKVSKLVSETLIREKISVLGRVKYYKELDFERSKRVFLDIACSREVEEIVKKEGIILVYKFPEYCKIYKIENSKKINKNQLNNVFMHDEI